MIDTTGKNQAFLSAIIESTDDAIIGKSLTGEILSWNPGAENIYGYTAKEIIGQNISLLVKGGLKMYQRGGVKVYHSGLKKMVSRS
jgi:PAS domain S-box-containing protein